MVKWRGKVMKHPISIAGWAIVAAPIDQNVAAKAKGEPGA
jgi:hypothetical protein